MKKLLTSLLGILILFSCEKEDGETRSLSSLKTEYTQFVNPFIGTSKMGHLFPGATAPFGMVQLSPQTNFNLILKRNMCFKMNYCLILVII